MESAGGQGAYAPRSISFERFRDTPQDYQENVIRLMAIQAYGERMAATASVEWIRKAPNYSVRRTFAMVLAEEARHSALLYRELDRLGISEQEAVDIAQGRRGRGPLKASIEGPEAVGDPDNEWLDIALNMMLLDRAGRYMIKNYADGSYEPWASVCERILADETMHESFGLAQFLNILRQTRDRDYVARKFSRWFALGLNFFGPPSRHKYDLLRGYGLKRRSNEEMRQQYYQEVVGIASKHGCEELIRLQASEFPYG